MSEHTGSNNPGITKTLTVGDAWQRLGEMFDPDHPTELTEGNARASGVYLTVTGYNIQIAFADITPTIATGHTMAAGDTGIWSNPSWIKRAWIRNDTAGSAATLAVTPTFAI